MAKLWANGQTSYWQRFLGEVHSNHASVLTASTKVRRVESSLRESGRGCAPERRSGGLCVDVSRGSCAPEVNAPAAEECL